MRRRFAVFSTVLVVSGVSTAWSTSKEYPSYEPPALEEAPKTNSGPDALPPPLEEPPPVDVSPVPVSEPSAATPGSETSAVAAPPAEAEKPQPPAATPEAFLKPYRVRIYQDNGDCLWRIAQKMYGDRTKWKLIYLANKDVIKDPNRIYPKQKLKIPPTGNPILMVTKKIHLTNSQEALLLLGQHDQNLRSLETTYGVQIFGRAHILSVRGAPGKVEKVLEAIDEMRQNLNSEKAVEPSPDAFAEKLETVAYTSAIGKNVRPKTPTQREYVEAIAKNDLVIAIGPAGTGKTYLAVACALAALKGGQVSRILLTRPVVEAGEKLGFLPGDFYDKVNPYLRPLYDAFHLMLGPDRFRLYRDEETIEIAPLAYMRGRTLDHAFIILDEGQNATPEQMKMFLTRMGQGSKVVVNGDVTQIDLENRKKSGLVNLPLILKGIPGIQFVHFTEADVVRHGLVKEVIRAYNDWDKREESR